MALPVSLPLLLALSRWRHQPAQFLLLMAIVPQRGIYDLLSLWSLLKTPKQLLALNGLSWLLYALVNLGSPVPFPILSVTVIYLPCLFLIMRDPITHRMREYQNRRKSAV